MEKEEKHERILCPACFGNGYTMEVVNAALSEVPCIFCQGRKLVLKVTTIEYRLVQEEKK